MTADGPAPIAGLGRPVTTACGGRVELSPNTSRAVYHGKWIYFCLPDCLRQFESDPTASCLAEHLQSDQG
jgi:YHS domain-containing protein